MIEQYLDLWPLIYSKLIGPLYFILVAVSFIISMIWLCYLKGQATAEGYKEMVADDCGACWGFGAILNPIFWLLAPAILLLTPILIPVGIILYFSYRSGKSSIIREEKKKEVLNLKEEREKDVAYQEFLAAKKVKETLGKDYIDPNKI